MVDGTYKTGGSGKGQAVRVGLNLDQYGVNLDRTHGTRLAKCLDCSHFRGINVADIVSCKPGKKNKGLTPCSEFIN